MAVAAAVIPFCQDMGLAYAAADVAVSRSGASSLTELSAFGLPDDGPRQIIPPLREEGLGADG